MTTLDKKAAFVHVIDSHRWLSSASYAWNLVKPGGIQEGQFDNTLPNVQVFARDCLLLHARSLIKFYRSKGRSEDILLSDFCIPAIPPAVDACLDKYERPVEVHLLHLTDWRDPSYRGSHPPTRGTTVRPEWNQEASVIADKIISECLKHASDKGGNWQPPFTNLYNATAARFRNGSHTWPKELSEKSDVEEYLTSLGL